MHILFIYPDIRPPESLTRGGALHYGIASISAVLKQAGHTCSLLHILKEPSPRELVGDVDRVKPDLVAFSTTTHQFQYVRLFSGWIKQSLKVPTICGGVHTTLAPEEVIKENAIDMVCVGEGEYAMRELADSLEQGKDITNIQNLWVKADGRLYKNPPRPLIGDLDGLPLIDRDLFNYERILERLTLKKQPRTGRILASRGCPFKCTYCCNSALKELYRGQPFLRQRSVDNVLQEIDCLVSKYKVAELYFEDELFTMQPKWVLHFCRDYKAKYNLPFICDAHPATLTKEVAYAVKEAGCVQVSLAIETGNEWLRQEVLQRPVSNEHLAKAFSLAKEAGIAIHSYVMVGLPYETPAMAEETQKIVETLKPDQFQLSIFYPYPGTELYHLCSDKGWLTGEERATYFETTVLNQPSMSKKQVEHYFRKLYTLWLGNVLRSLYPWAYPFYRFSRCLLGESTIYQLSIFFRKLILKSRMA